MHTRTIQSLRVQGQGVPTADDDKLEFGAPGSGFAFPWAVPVACRRTHAPHAASALLAPIAGGWGEEDRRCASVPCRARRTGFRSRKARLSRQLAVGPWLQRLGERTCGRSFRVRLVA